ncbi:MAG TPA: DUF4383 domain-containing protein [Burkholderiales bacterium]|nr:DUF4383 domain-containing protein [Burkholderiales bacterium]
MKTSTFALIFGVAYLAAGLLGLIPAMLTPPPVDAPGTKFTLLYGYLFGLFPVNILQSVVNIAIGAWGIAAGSGRASSTRFARSLAVFFGALAILGMLPMTNTLFGAVPLHSNDVWLHAVSAVIAAYFGWRQPAGAGERRRLSNDRRYQMAPVVRERRLGLSDRREHWSGMTPA